MSSSSFLPDDYLDQKAERRTNIISLVLFAVVMLGVFGAFLFTNQRWADVKRDQTAINVRYEKAAGQIKKLIELEDQKQEMLQKADLAAALVERVPRSVLLAELINRMPDRLSLLDFKLKSERVKPRKAPSTTKDRKSKRLKPERAKKKSDAEEAAKKVRPPKYRVSIALVGVAPTGKEVSRYLAELNAFDLLEDVRLEYTEEKDIEGQKMQQFQIRMKLDPDADVRDIEPLIQPREETPTFRVDVTPPGAGDEQANGEPDDTIGMTNTNDPAGLESVLDSLREAPAEGDEDDTETESAVAEARDDRGGE